MEWKYKIGKINKQYNGYEIDQNQLKTYRKYTIKIPIYRNENEEVLVYHANGFKPIRRNEIQNGARFSSSSSSSNNKIFILTSFLIKCENLSA